MSNLHLSNIRMLLPETWEVSTRDNDIDLPDGILDALSQLYWSERYPAACG
jgi:hypothetical protein